jgi:hypothetical protein
VPAAPGIGELRDPSGQMVVRASDMGRQPNQRYADYQTLEVGDNDLPVVWLFAVVLGCQQWGQ